MHLVVPLILLAASASAAAQQTTLNLTNADAVAAATTTALWPLMQFFPSNSGNNNGAWIEQYSNGHWLIQWHESGIFHDQFYSAFRFSTASTSKYRTTTDNLVQLAVKDNGDFLEGHKPSEQISGRWSDDIAWWALAVTSAAEAFGPSAILAPSNPLPNQNPTYLSIASTTFDEVWVGWDETACNGGIYWSRNRNATKLNEKYYKSTITNVQEMNLGARLYKLTNNTDYKAKVDKIYAWLKSSGIISADYLVYDGIMANDCSVDKHIYSYHIGELLSALATMYQATKSAEYLTEATILFLSLRRQFVDPTTAVLSQSLEPSCIPVNGTTACKYPSGYFWPVYKGLGTLFTASTDPDLRSQLTQVLTSSAASNFKGCDENWYCIRNLPEGMPFTMLNGTNPRDQIETVALLNALNLMNSAAPLQGTTDTSGPAGAIPGVGVGSSSSSSTNIGAIVGGIVGGLVVLSVAIAAFIIYRRRQLQSTAKSAGQVPITSLEDGLDSRRGGEFLVSTTAATTPSETLGGGSTLANVTVASEYSSVPPSYTTYPDSIPGPDASHIEEAAVPPSVVQNVAALSTPIHDSFIAPVDVPVIIAAASAASEIVAENPVEPAVTVTPVIQEPEIMAEPIADVPAVAQEVTALENSEPDNFISPPSVVHNTASTSSVETESTYVLPEIAILPSIAISTPSIHNAEIPSTQVTPIPPVPIVPIPLTSAFLASTEPLLETNDTITEKRKSVRFNLDPMDETEKNIEDVHSITESIDDRVIEGADGSVPEIGEVPAPTVDEVSAIVAALESAVREKAQTLEPEPVIAKEVQVPQQDIDIVGMISAVLDEAKARQSQSQVSSVPETETSPAISDEPVEEEGDDAEGEEEPSAATTATSSPTKKKKKKNKKKKKSGASKIPADEVHETDQVVVIRASDMLL